MSQSLQDQLLGAGLVDKKKAKQVDKAKRKQAKVQRRSGEPAVDEIKQAAQQAREEKAQRDRELSQQQNEKAQKKAIAAQIKQLIETNCIPRKGELEYNFTDGKKIKKLYVDQTMLNQLSRGRLAIVKLGDQYEVVATPVAEKIRERNESYIVSIADPKESESGMSAEEEEWYADYEIPDDLMW